jgi:hypothetical protein
MPLRPVPAAAFAQGVSAKERSAAAEATPEYAARRPHDTVLRRLVREHYATFVAPTEATYASRFRAT